MSLPIIPSTGEIQLRGHIHAATQGSGTTNISLAGSSTGGFGMSFPSSYGPCEDMPDAIAGHGNAPYGMNELRGLSWNSSGGGGGPPQP